MISLGKRSSGTGTLLPTAETAMSHRTLARTAIVVLGTFAGFVTAIVAIPQRPHAW